MSDDAYTHFADVLRGIADDLAGLAGTGIPAPWDVHLSIYVAGSDAVDGIAKAVFGDAGVTRQIDGGWYHRAVAAVVSDRARSGPAVGVEVVAEAADPAERELRAEVERLRTQLAERGAAQPDTPADANPLPTDPAGGNAGPVCPEVAR